jgi:hypothetical protein
MPIFPPPRKWTTTLLQKYPVFSPWDYNREEELPTTLTWTKVNTPDACEVFRWDHYQKCDIVTILTTRGLEDGLIVRAFDDDEQGIQCVIAWIYTKQGARNRSIYSLPLDTKYFFSNHFQLINSECFVRRASLEVRNALLNDQNYGQGIDFSSRTLVKFRDADNCIVEARRSMAHPFASIPRELQDMVFGYIINSEDDEHDTVKAEQTGPKSRPSWGLRSVSKEFLFLYDQACIRQRQYLRIH